MNPPSVIRNLEETQQAWKELREDNRIAAYFNRLSNAENVFTQEEIDLNNRILSGFLKALRPSIEREIEENDVILSSELLSYRTSANSQNEPV